MKKKLKIALIHRSSEQGFAIPIAMGLGLAMLLVGAMMIVRSQGDQVSASAQKATNRGLSAAETAITRTLVLINNNPVIATYPLTAPTGNPSWTNASSIPGIGCSNGGATVATFASTTSTNWTDVDPPVPNQQYPGDPSKGQFKVTGYTYNPNNPSNPNQPPGTATLTVEGRVNQIGSSTPASTTVGTATTQLQVNIPVQQGNRIGIPLPGMWVTNSVDTNKISANVLASCTGYVSGSVAFDPGYTLSRLNLSMPNPPSKPTYTIPTISDPSQMNPPILPRVGDQPTNSTTGEYEYSVSKITGTFTITPGKKVAIYLDGNIDMTGGQQAILHQCTSVPNCSPSDARIYGLSTAGQLNLGGNASICDIFFLAPTYAVTLNGGGQAQGCGGGANNNGIYWVKSWSGGGQGNHTSLAQTSATWNDLSFLPIQLPPQIAPITSWQRQEASP